MPNPAATKTELGAWDWIAAEIDHGRSVTHTIPSLPNVQAPLPPPDLPAAGGALDVFPAFPGPATVSGPSLPSLPSLNTPEAILGPPSTSPRPPSMELPAYQSPATPPSPYVEYQETPRDVVQFEPRQSPVFLEYTIGRK